MNIQDYGKIILSEAEIVVALKKNDRDELKKHVFACILCNIVVSGNPGNIYSFSQLVENAPNLLAEVVEELAGELDGCQQGRLAGQIDRTPDSEQKQRFLAKAIVALESSQILREGKYLDKITLAEQKIVEALLRSSDKVPACLHKADSLLAGMENISSGFYNCFGYAAKGNPENIPNLVRLALKHRAALGCENARWAFFNMGKNKHTVKGFEDLLKAQMREESKGIEFRDGHHNSWIEFLGPKKFFRLMVEMAEMGRLKFYGFPFKEAGLEELPNVAQILKVLDPLGDKLWNDCHHFVNSLKEKAGIWEEGDYGSLAKDKFSEYPPALRMFIVEILPCLIAEKPKYWYARDIVMLDHFKAVDIDSLEWKSVLEKLEGASVDDSDIWWILLDIPAERSEEMDKWLRQYLSLAVGKLKGIESGTALKISELAKAAGLEISCEADGVYAKALAADLAAREKEAADEKIRVGLGRKFGLE